MSSLESSVDVANHDRTRGPDRTDEVIREVRKQGRAAIAAQAAAESCLTAMTELRAEVLERIAVPTPTHTLERLIRDLMPFSDALDRLIEATQRRACERGSWLARFLGRAPADTDRAVAEGALLLRRQLEAILAEHGVEIGRPMGEPFDPETERAIATAPCEPGQAPGQVVAVLRPSFSLGGRVLREADVTVSASNSKPQEKIDE